MKADIAMNLPTTPGSHQGYRLLRDSVRSRSRWVLVALVCNLLGAVFEGGTFGVILVALKLVSDGPDSAIATLGFLSEPLGGMLVAIGQTKLFILLIAMAVVLQALRSTIVYVGSLGSVQVAAKVQADVQKTVFAHIMKLSFGCANRYTAGDLADRVVTPSPALSEAVVFVNQVIVSFLMVIGYAFVMLRISPPLTVAAVILFGAVSFAQKGLVTNIRNRALQRSEVGARLNQQIIESLHALRTIHTFNRQKTSVREVESTIDRVVQLSRVINRAVAILGPLGETLTIGSVGAFLIIGVLVLQGNGSSTIPELLTFTVILNRLASAANAVPRGAAEVSRRFGQIDRLDAILREDDKEFVVEGSESFVKLERELLFQNVCLRYPGASADAVRNLSFRLAKGSVTAVVGGSGAGKTSIADLLLRLHEPTSGAIYADGVSIGQFTLESWRGALGVVSQDAFLFNTTIRENIRFSLPSATDKEIEAAAALANAHDFISALPEGYDTLVGDRGYGLSGGQRQRIALARAVLRQPQILLLDEATSALDSVSERLIQEALDVFTKDRTVLVIAHRLSTISHADRILLIEGGVLVEEGTHRQLMELNGHYANYWSLQSQRISAESIG
jgi:ATP-binding cassette subfamily B protein/subfamily B ATP-binding cassette protein MsbA